MLNNIRIVLVNTTHPGNIGASARAMKTMGLSRLYLVSPKVFPHVEATARASGADDVLAKTVVVDSLNEAISDCQLVIGTSARTRGIPWPFLEFTQAADKSVVDSQQQQVAVVFGQERSGLTNEELDLCHFVTNIPCDEAYPSLNLAAAVQIMCYQIRMAALGKENVGFLGINPIYELATADQLENFYKHLREVLVQSGFLDPENPRKVMRRLTRLFNRTRLELRELNILRGILKSVQNAVISNEREKSP